MAKRVEPVKGRGKAEPLVKSLGMITLHVSNVERAVAFYRDVLGIPLTRYDEKAGVAVFKTEATPLMLHVPYPGEGGREVGGVTGLYFSVLGVRGIVREMKERGVRVTFGPVRQPWGTLEAGFADPDGNEFVMAEAVKPKRRRR